MYIHPFATFKVCTVLMLDIGDLTVHKIAIVKEHLISGYLLSFLPGVVQLSHLLHLLPHRIHWHNTRVSLTR